MAKHRRKYHRRRKLKLKQTTIYSIFAFGLILTGGLLFLSFTRSGQTLSSLSDLMQSNFGSASYLFPMAFIFFGFFFLKLKMVLSRPHVAVGYLLLFITLDTLLKAGSVGASFFQTIADIISPLGAFLLFLAGFLIGIVVFFNTSVDEILAAVHVVGTTLFRLFPQSLFSFFKKSDTGLSGKEMKIKGGGKELPNLAKDAVPQPLTMNKKEPQMISDKLIANSSLLSTGIWEYPPLSLLNEMPGQKADRGDVKRIAGVIERTLQSFGVGAKVVEVNLGPAVTQYALEIALGTKVSKITALANDLALATEAPTGQIRIEAPIPGRNLVGIEIPNRSLEVVTLRTMLSSSVLQKSKSKLTISLGLDVSGNPIIADIAKMPHVLVAGTTGSGKSVLVNSFISSFLFRASPTEVKLILIDPKRVEFTQYNGIPHLLTPVIVEVEKILSSLKWAMSEMDRRYRLFAERGVRNIDSYNELSGFQALPYIVIIVDELADLMMFAPVEVEDAIARLAQMARATGIHLVIATQRPSVNVITGLIKANIPTRIAFNVSSMIDSRVILDSPGAEKLLGRGDMLFIPPDQAKPTRIQGAFVSEKEVKKVVDFLKQKSPVVEYTEEVTTQSLPLKKGGSLGTAGGDGHDSLFDEAVRAVCQYDRASASLLQRRLSIGYARAARILDQLEEAGIVGPGEGSKPRDVLMRNPDEYFASRG